MLLCRLNKFLRRDIGPEIVHLDAAALEHYLDEILADIVQVALDRADQDRADDGRDRGRNVDGAVADGAEVCEHTGVDHQNVGHRHERGNTGHDLCPDGRTVFLQVESFLHGEISFSLILLRIPAQLFREYHSILSRKKTEGRSLSKITKR